jgi:hypothetical protein
VLPVLAIAGALTAVLAAFAGQYGYHRDELYFLACGRHLAWGYPDQPPFVPLVARLMSDLAPGSLVVLRLPSALAAGALPVTLPIVPVSALHDTPIVTFNYDAGETIGWPAFVKEIARVYRSLPAARRASAVVLTSNYGEAGAVDRFGPADGLPSAYSVQNSFWYWGPPPASAAVVVAVGFGRAQLGFCGSVQLAATLNNLVDVADQEQGQPVWICTQLRSTWPAIWPSLRDIG